MTPADFQAKHGFNLEDMERIRALCLATKGTVTKIEDKEKEVKSS